MEIHQLLAGFEFGDAISDHALALRQLFHRWGYGSEIYAEHLSPRMWRVGHYYADHVAGSRPQHLAILHFSIGSTVTGYFRRIPDRKVIIYHNITPAEYFEPFDARIADLLRRGRQELLALRDGPELAIAVSEYNRQELVAAGYARTAAVPILIDFTRFDRRPDGHVLRTFGDGRTNVLSVGRIAPNKRVEEIITAFACYQRYVNGRARLLLAGGYDEDGRYMAFLRTLVERLRLDEVHFLGRVSWEAWTALARVAVVHLSLSEHEGFCLPLVESMYLGVPVIAYAAAAVPETLGGAGVLIAEKRPEEIAELIHLVATDSDLRRDLIGRGRRRASAFRPEAVAARLRTVLGALLAGTPAPTVGREATETS